MNRSEIKTRFREENPEITDRVITDAVLDSWLLEGNLNFAIRARIIQKKDTFTPAIGEGGYGNEWDLTDKISDFFDIDEYPGGGVAHNDLPLKKTTVAKMDAEDETWRTQSNGTPDEYYRWGQWLGVDYPVSNTDDITVYYIALPEDFDDDGKTPFNQLANLTPYHYALVLYLTMRAKSKVGKPQEKMAAAAEYAGYIQWVKTMLAGGRQDAIQFKRSRAYK